MYNINTPLPTPHALRVKPGVLVISTITPTIPVSPTKVCDTVLRALHTLTHLILTTTQGIIHYEQHIISALGTGYYFIYIQME